MAKVVKKAVTNSRSYWETMLGELNCSLVSTSVSGQYLAITLNNDAVINLGFDGGPYGRPMNIYYNGATTTFDNPQYPYLSGGTATFCYSDTLFYMKITNSVTVSSNKGMTVLYEIINNEPCFGFVWNNNSVDISAITLTNHNGLGYSHGTLLNYDTQPNVIDFMQNDAVFNSGTYVQADPNFSACTSVTLDRVITLNGSNYYTVGTHTMVPIDESNS